MIAKNLPILPGTIVQHDEGLLYKVEDIRKSTVDYEKDHKLNGLVVNYTQLEQGSFPAGTKWSKDEDGFRKYFTVVEKKISK